jgi:predicted permease
MFGWQNRRIESELDAELQDHLERQAADYVASGMTPEEALRRARLSLGGTEQVKEECRDVHYWRGLEASIRDLKYALRSLRKSPGFTAVAILLLAIGIGSNLAVFSLIDPLFLRLLPVENPWEVVQISLTDKDGSDRPIFSKVMEPLRDEGLFRGICGFNMPWLTAEINRSVRGIRTLAMTGDCFATLGLRMQVGRPFTLSDDERGAERVALITDSLWRRSFAAVPDVLGKQIAAEGVVFTIIGVVAPGFTGLTPGYPTDLIIPLAQTPVESPPPGDRPIHFWVSVLARVPPSVPWQQVQARMSTAEKRLLEQSVPLFYNPNQKRDYIGRRITVRSAMTGVETGQSKWMSDRFGKPLYAVWGICSLVLLVGGVNLAILFLGRGLARQREIAVRLALGANRLSIVRLLALESLPLVLVGAAAGAVAARWMNHIVAAQANEMFAIVLSPASLNPGLDLRTGAFLAGLVGAVALVLTVVPVWQASRFGGANPLNESGRGLVGSSTRNQKILLGTQVALTLALVSASGFFTSSLRYLYDIDLGLETRGVSMVTLTRLPGVSTKVPHGPYYRDLVGQLAAFPNVSSAVVADYAPFWSGTYLEPVTSAENSSANADILTQTAVVTERFFETLGVPVVAGEGFQPSGSVASESRPEIEAIVSESLAKHFGGEGLIGRHISVGNRGPYERLRVVGISANVQPSLANPEEREPLFVYINLWQHPDIRYPVILVKTKNGPPMTATEFRGVIEARGQHYVENYRTLDQSKDQALIENRLLADLSSGFGVLSLLLAATGLFGLLSYQVASRTSEIGLRMALGANRRQIQWYVLRQLVPVMIAGILGGVAFTLGLGRLMAGLVFGISAQDPRLIVLSVVTLIATAVLAALIPARKATSVDPLIALRHE